MLPNNRSLALRSLFHLKTRLERDPRYHKDYVKFMEKVIEECAENCSQEGEEDPGRPGRINYIPHYGVYHPKRPVKIRVVFDCSARYADCYAGTCLNQSLLSHCVTN